MFAALSRFWQTSDGSVRLHANYPWHRQRALRVLACPDDPDSGGKALAQLPMAEVEESFAAAGALAFGVRTPAQWRLHPQERAVHELPLVQRTAAGAGTRPAGPGRARRG